MLIKLIILALLMDNKELIYELARKLNMSIEVHKKGEYQGTYKFINDKLHKLKDKKIELNELQRESGRDIY